MVNYADYNVDPWKGQRQGMNMLAESSKDRFNRGQADISNALAERQVDLSERSAERQDRRLDMSEARDERITKKQEDESEIKLIGVVSDTVGRALESVKDNQSHQAYRQVLGQIAQTPLGQSSFFQNILRNTPETFDPQKKEQGLRLLDGFRKQVEEKGFTLSPGQKRFDSSNREIASVPDKPADAADTASIKEYKYAKKEGYKGSFADWKAANESNPSEKANIVVVGGKQYTIDALRGLYKTNYDVPDEMQLLMMETSQDDTMKRQAAKLRARAADKPSFQEFMETVKREGKLPWDSGIEKDPFGIR